MTYAFLLGRTAEHLQREAADADQPFARVPFSCVDQDGAPPIIRRQRFGDAYIVESANAITSGQHIVVRMRLERWLTADYTQS